MNPAQNSFVDEQLEQVQSAPFFTTWSPLIENLSKVDRKKAERINQELQKKLCQTCQTEAAIDLACDQDQVLPEHFPQVARSHRAGQYLDEECHIEGETEFEAAVAECCDARNRYQPSFT